MNTHGLQRFVDLLWSRAEDNTDTENPIVVLGREYTSHIRQPATANDEITVPEAGLEQEEQGNEEKQESSIADISVSDIKNYFQSFSLTKSDPKKEEPATTWPDDFMDDVQSRIWLTYRTKFAPLQRDLDGPSPLSLQNLIRGQNYQLHGDYFTTDCGWGCMIRTGQTMVANALLNLNLGRDWRFNPEYPNQKHYEIVSWFADVPEQPFSIHRIVDKGRELSGKKAGEWFGPSAAARSIQALCNEFDSGLRVYIGSDSGDVYEQDVFKASGGAGDDFQPTLILLGVRLGVDDVNQVYWQSLKDILSSAESVGIAGGRPSSSHYFFGYQGDYLFYLDPHIPQAALKESDDETIEPKDKIPLDIQSVHTNKIRRIHLSELDPSMLVGFLIKNGDEWDEWKRLIQYPENKNKIVHISPDENPVSLHNNRKPSFVLVNGGGDDFIDVGLEYDEIPEEDALTAVEIEMGATISDQMEEVNKDEEGNESLVIVSDSTNIATVESRAMLSSRNTSVSFEDYTGSIKDDYENIATITERLDSSNPIEVHDTLNDPYVVVKDETDESYEHNENNATQPINKD